MITNKVKEQERLSRSPSDEMPKERDGLFHEKPHKREQPDAAVLDSPKHDVALWATPQEESHALVLMDQVFAS